MRKKRFTEHQIIKVLKQVEGGRTVIEVCREYGVSQGTYYNWKGKYGGLEASDIKRLKELEAENRKLKQMFSNLLCDNYLVRLMTTILSGSIW